MLTLRVSCNLGLYEKLKEGNKIIEAVGESVKSPVLGSMSWFPVTEGVRLITELVAWFKLLTLLVSCY